MAAIFGWMPRRHRNIVFKLALVVMSVALASVGVFGWADAANAFEALQHRSWALLNDLWPLYAAASLGCLAAQVIAACATVNFARLAAAAHVWRLLAGGFYAAAVFFAAYSADRGAQVVLMSAHRSAYETREIDRTRLQTEIQSLTRTIEDERRKLPADTTNTMTSRQQSALAIFEATTATARERLPQAQQELQSKPPLPREASQDLASAIGVFLIFLAWAVLEPWGYALAERGREAALAPARALVPIREAPAPQSANVHWFRRALAILTLGWVSHFVTAAPALASQPLSYTPPPEPIALAAWQDAKAIAFSMRDRFDVAEIARHVRRDKSTVYRWFRERDRQQKEAVAA